METPKPTDSSPAPQNSFLTVLQQKELQCAVLSEASELLATAAKAVNEKGKKASITLKLSLSYNAGAIACETKLTSAIPENPQPLCIFYADDEGNLFRNDPRQREFLLKAHDGGKTPESAQPAKEVANG